MELCSLEDAFPNISTGSLVAGPRDKGSGFPFVGGTDSKPSREERRAARKKAKKCKGPVGAYIEAQAEDVPDPDRLAIRRLGAVEAFQSGGVAAGATGTDEGEFTVPQVPPLAKQRPIIPAAPKASCSLTTDAGYPSYFGRSDDDPVEESFSAYSGAAGDDPNYRLEPDFTKTFEFKGAQKAAGGALPAPNLEDSWKPMTGAASYTAFTPDPGAAAGRGNGIWAIVEERVAVPGGARGSAPPPLEPAVPVPSGEVVGVPDSKREERDALLARIDSLMGRLELLEKKKIQDTQTELLLFVGTGLGLLVVFEMMSRR